MKAWHQFGVSIQSHKHVGVSILAALWKLRSTLLFHSDECPQLVELQLFAAQIAHHTVHQYRATIPDANH